MGVSVDAVGVVDIVVDDDCCVGTGDVTFVLVVSSIVEVSTVGDWKEGGGAVFVEGCGGGDEGGLVALRFLVLTVGSSSKVIVSFVVARDQHKVD